MIILPSYMGIDKPLESKDPLLTNQYVMVHFRRKCFFATRLPLFKKNKFFQEFGMPNSPNLFGGE